MLDERVQSTEGRLEGREPIGRLFRNIEEGLRAICNSLSFCCEVQTVKEFTRRKALNQLTSIRISVVSSSPGVRQMLFLGHGLQMRVLE